MNAPASALIETVSVSPAALSAALGQFPPTSEQAAVIEAPLRAQLVVAGAGSQVARDLVIERVRAVVLAAAEAEDDEAPALTAVPGDTAAG